MARNVGAAVEIELIFRQQIDIVEHETVKLGIHKMSTDFEKGRIVKQAFVKRQSIILFDDEDLIFDQLSGQKEMQIRNQLIKMLFSIAKWNQNGHFLTGTASVGLEMTAVVDIQRLLQLLIGQVWKQRRPFVDEIWD